MRKSLCSRFPLICSLLALINTSCDFHFSLLVIHSLLPRHLAFLPLSNVSFLLVALQNIVMRMNFIGDKRYLNNKISVDIYTFSSCNLFQQFLLKEDADNEFFRHASIHLHVPEVGCVL